MTGLQMPSIDEIITKTLSRLIVFEGIPKIFAMFGWTSMIQKIIGTLLGLTFKVITLIVLNQSVITMNYYIDLKSRLFAVIVLNISHIIITMGTVWSEEKVILDRKKAEADRKKAEADRKKADENFQIIQNQMKDMMNAIRCMNPNDSILEEIEKNEKKIPIGFSIKQDYNYNYNIIDILTGDELKQ